MKVRISWGAAVAAWVCSGVAFAQVPGPGNVGAAGSPPVAPSGTAGAAGAPSTSAPAPAPVEGAPAPAPATPPEATTAPAPPTTQADANADADEDEAEDEAPRKKRKGKKKKKRRYYVEEDEGDVEVAQDEEISEHRPEPSSWRLAGPHFILSAERITSILAWSQTATVDSNSFGGPPQSIEATLSGTDVSLLGAGGFGRNPFTTPRVGLDYVFPGGFSLGGSLGYMVTSGESEFSAGGGSSKSDIPTEDVIVFAPRLGVFLQGTPKVGVWLRGGLTHVVSTLSDEETDGNGFTQRTEQTTKLWDLSFDPALVLSPVPHVGITIGASLDIGLSGTIKETSGTSTTGDETDITASSYGVTAGLVAMF